MMIPIWLLIVLGVAVILLVISVAIFVAALCVPSIRF